MRQTLETTLAELHEHLSHAEDLDAEEVRLLRGAVEEIQSTLDDTEVNSATLAQRLVESTRHFGETHPLLTNTIGRIADLLSQMGI